MPTSWSRTTPTRATSAWDGDSEEVDIDEMAEILVGPVMPEALQRTPRGGGRCFQRWDHSSLGGSVLVEMEVDAIGLSPGIWRKPLRPRRRCCRLWRKKKWRWKKMCGPHLHLTPN